MSKYFTVNEPAEYSKFGYTGDAISLLDNYNLDKRGSIWKFAPEYDDPKEFIIPAYKVEPILGWKDIYLANIISRFILISGRFKEILDQLKYPNKYFYETSVIVKNIEKKYFLLYISPDLNIVDFQRSKFFIQSGLSKNQTEINFSCNTSYKDIREVLLHKLDYKYKIFSKYIYMTDHKYSIFRHRSLSSRYIITENLRDEILRLNFQGFRFEEIDIPCFST